MIEDRLRASMTAHDGEAPDASGLVVPEVPASRRGQLAAGVAVVAIIAVVIATFSLHNRTSGRPPISPAAGAVTALDCPAAVGSTAGDAPWVPTKPKGVDGASRLAPVTTPSRVIVCAFIAPRSPAGHSGSVVLSGDLSGVAEDLAWAPPAVTGSSRACAAYLAITDGDNYLIGLSYPGGTMWVAAPANHCAGSGNGSFTSPANLSGVAKNWYRAGRWTTDPAEKPCLGDWGRLGQQLRMVPDGAVSVTACEGTKPGATRSAGDATVRQLIRLLDGKGTEPSAAGCQPTGGTFDQYELLFNYSVGPPVTLRVEAGCVPALDNGSLQAQDASDVLPLVRAIVAGR